VVTLDSQYGDDSNSYEAGDLLVIYSVDYPQLLTSKIVSSTYNGTNTEITISINYLVGTAYVGALGRLNDGMGGTYWTGAYTIAGNGAHVEGSKTKAGGLYSHAEGSGTVAIGDLAHAEGADSIAIGPASHAEGFDTQTSGYFSHAEGLGTRTFGQGSHTEGMSTTALGDYSHTEGSGTADGLFGFRFLAYEHLPSSWSLSLTEEYGDQTVSIQDYIIIKQDNEDGYLTATCNYIYYDGNNTILEIDAGILNESGTLTGAVGFMQNPLTSAADQFIKSSAAHAEGYSSIALGEASHAEGNNTAAFGNYQHVQGEYNLPSTNPGAFIIGNGYYDSNTNVNVRSNLVYASGSSMQVTGSIDVKGTITNNGTNLQALSIAYAIALG
jgi:hypothetical protein